MHPQIPTFTLKQPLCFLIWNEHIQVASCFTNLESLC